MVNPPGKAQYGRTQNAFGSDARRGGPICIVWRSAEARSSLQLASILLIGMAPCQPWLVLQYVRVCECMATDRLSGGSRGIMVRSN